VVERGHIEPAVVRASKWESGGRGTKIKTTGDTHSIAVSDEWVKHTVSLPGKGNTSTHQGSQAGRDIGMAVAERVATRSIPTYLDGTGGGLDRAILFLLCVYLYLCVVVRTERSTLRGRANLNESTRKSG
jgi:hypothetical protein